MRDRRGLVPIDHASARAYARIGADVLPWRHRSPGRGPSGHAQDTSTNGGAMPTADEYRQAARQLRSLGEDLGSDWTTLRTATDVDRIAGGAVGAVLDRSLETVRTELTRTRSELDRLAAICDRRAEICADHAADVQRHRALVTSTDTWTSPPPAPAWWVAT